MGSIIQFPKRQQRYRKKIEDFFVERLPDHEQHCNLGETRFTCATCQTTANFAFNGIIFKNLTFYCGHCGVGYKMNNPLFTRKKASKSQ
jgi:hypothetical protein